MGSLKKLLYGACVTVLAGGLSFSVHQNIEYSRQLEESKSIGQHFYRMAFDSNYRETVMASSAELFKSADELYRPEWKILVMDMNKGQD